MRFHFVKSLKGIWVFLFTQAFSTLGSAMTSFALVIWAYQREGSALQTALLSICSYAPYVLVSIFAGALSDRWNKKSVMLACDSFAAACTLAVGILLHVGRLELWHLYLLNALSGLMNTFQQPACDVTVTLLTPKESYQRASGLRSLTNSMVSILSPAMATSLLAFAGIRMVLLFDLLTFTVAFLTLLLWIDVPECGRAEEKEASVFQMAGSAVAYLRDQAGILHLMLFLAAINLIASIYSAALPAMLLSRDGAGETALGAVETAAGIAMLVGSVIASVMPAPRSRVRVIFGTLLLSMGVENLMLAVGRSIPIWCVAAVLGWIAVPAMNANMDVVMRSRIPVNMQGRVYAARNTFQYFTIPIGYLLGGMLVDRVFEPYMLRIEPTDLPALLFGTGKGSGAAFLFFWLWLAGIAVCLIFLRDRKIWMLEEPIGEEREKSGQ